MKLAVSIDVEEEGLFSTKYDSRDVPVSNVSRLNLLDPIFRDLGIHPTLLPSYQVVRHKAHQDLLRSLTEKWDGEIGAHLHPWNTPPFASLPYPEPVPSELTPRDILSAKLETLLDALASMGVRPVSFRMGRFNMGPRMLSVLEETKIKVDGSIAPMRKYYGGPAHLYAPTDPYFPDPADPCSPGSSRILEVPMTILPIAPRLGFFLERLDKLRLVPGGWISWFAMNLASLPAQPMWTGLRRLKAGVRVHRARRGRVLSIFFHSSELLPGGAPQHSTDASVELFLEKLRSFFSWLRREINVESLTLSQLFDLYQRTPSSVPDPSE